MGGRRAVLVKVGSKCSCNYYRVVACLNFSKETQYKASIFKSTKCFCICNSCSAWVLMDVLLRAGSFGQNVDIAQYWLTAWRSQRNTGFRNFACSFLLHDDHFGHEAAYDRLGPLTVWKQSLSVWLLCAFSATDTLAIMSHLFFHLKSIAIIIILLLMSRQWI